jgi:phospholipase/lecithinase/hemolysin
MAALQYSNLYAFGDSLSDAGNDWIGTAGLLPVSPPYFQTSYGPGGTLTASVFSDGPVWVQDLSAELGTGTLRPSLYGGNDYAFGGAEANPSQSGFEGVPASAIALPSQLAQFDLAGDSSSTGLYTLSIGTNDVVSILGTAGLTPAQMAAQVANSVAAEVSVVSSLVDRGAQSFVVANVPDAGRLPEISQDNNPVEAAAATQLSSLYDVQLAAGLEALAQARGVTVNILPLFSLTEQAVANPAQFNLTNVTDPAWTGNLTDPTSGTVAANPDTHLFWDGIHPTNTVHQVIAADANSLATTGTLLNPTPVVQMTDVTAGQASTQFGTVATVPGVAADAQFLYPGFDSVAVRSDTPNSFLQGGPADDALQVTSGNNLLDGGSGSSFLVGGSGADTFQVYTESVPTWSTVVNFHAGDVVRMFGFHAGLSTQTFTVSDGVGGYQGYTLHSELNGAGTGVLGSLTFAGIDPATAAHFGISTGTLNAGTAGAMDYLQIQYNA